MSDLRTILPDRLITPAEAADMRHDLVTPLNLIIGYCELITTMPGADRAAGLLELIRAIRQHGLTLLRSIDRALLDDSPGRSTTDLLRLGPMLSAPSHQIIAVCDRCLGHLQIDELTAEAPQDLVRIRGAAQQMIELARSLEAGSRLPDGANRSTADA